MNDGHTLTANFRFKRLRASAAAYCIGAIATASIFVAGPVFAQNSLPAELIKAPALSESQKKEVEDFVRPLKVQLKDPAKLKTARQKLIDQLISTTDVSPSFRLELYRQVSDTVKEMINSTDPSQVVNGLRIAGEIATDNSVVLILDSLKSPKASVRYAASFAIMRAFENSVRGKGPAMDRSTAQQLINRVAVAMKIETDVSCFDSMVRALAAAGADNIGIDKVQADGLKALGATTAEILKAAGNKAIDDGILESMVRACTIVRDSFTRPKDAPAWVEEGAQLSGEAISYVYRQLRKPNSEIESIKAGDNEGTIEAKKAARRVVTQLVTIAESTAHLARQFPNKQAQGTNINMQIRSADSTSDAHALEDMKTLLNDMIKDIPNLNFPL